MLTLPSQFIFVTIDVSTGMKRLSVRLSLGIYRSGFGGGWSCGDDEGHGANNHEWVFNIIEIGYEERGEGRGESRPYAYWNV